MLHPAKRLALTRGARARRIWAWAIALGIGEGVPEQRRRSPLKRVAALLSFNALCGCLAPPEPQQAYGRRRH
jgi:hypothetical protein